MDALLREKNKSHQNTCFFCAALVRAVKIDCQKGSRGTQIQSFTPLVGELGLHVQFSCNSPWLQILLTSP